MNLSTLSPRLLLNALVLCLSSGLIACNGGAGGGENGDGPTPYIPGDGDDDGGDDIPSTPAPYAQTTWQYDNIEVGSASRAAGFQGTLSQSADGTLYYAYMVDVQDEPTCDIAVFGGGEASNVSYALRLAVKAPSESSWTLETVPVEDAPVTDAIAFIGARFGLDSAFDSDGNLVLAMAAGGPGLFTCASSDLILATRTATDSFTLQGPVTDSSACCNECFDDECGSGTDVGAWASIARAPSGNLFVAYTDYHNFADQDGQTVQGLEMWQEGGPVFGVQPFSGFGLYSDLVFADDTPVVAYTGYNGPGLVVKRRTGSANAVADWQGSVLLSGSSIGERLSMAVAGDGTVGIAVHERNDGFEDVHDLRYCESTDGGETWSTCESVGQPNVAVSFPSLAFDNENRPVIAYRFCNSADTCQQDLDGVRMAWRENDGTWSTTNVHLNAATFSGLYAQLTLDPVSNEPTIVFMQSTNGAAMVAYGSLPPQE